MHLDVAAAASTAALVEKQPACGDDAAGAHAQAASGLATACTLVLQAFWVALLRLLHAMMAQLAVWRTARLRAAISLWQQRRHARTADSAGRRRAASAAQPAGVQTQRVSAAHDDPTGRREPPPEVTEDPHGRAPRSCRLPLPLKAAEHAGKLTVCLDLDETLLCAYWLDELPLRLRPRLHTPSTALVHYGPPGDARSTLVVLERPGLRAFLARASALAELVLFTAGAASYALPIVRHVDPSGQLFGGRLLFRDATVGRGEGAAAAAAAGRGGGAAAAAAAHRCTPIKDLARLGRPLARTVLVDNSTASFLLQPANGVPCRPYRGAEGDCQLLDVILPLLTSLARVDDVRPCLAAQFKLAAWFRSKGLPVEDPVVTG